MPLVNQHYTKGRIESSLGASVISFSLKYRNITAHVNLNKPEKNIETSVQNNSKQRGEIVAYPNPVAIQGEC